MSGIPDRERAGSSRRAVLEHAAGAELLNDAARELFVGAARYLLGVEPRQRLPDHHFVLESESVNLKVRSVSRRMRSPESLLT